MGGRIVIMTGAAGFIGRHILMEAARQGNQDRWILTDREVPPTWWGLPVHTRFVPGDICSRDVLDALFTHGSPDAVVHLAGWLGKATTQENREVLLRSNLLSTFHLLDAIKAKADAKPLFVLPSTGLIYGDQTGPFREEFALAPPDDYSLTKLLAEETLHTFARNGAIRSCIVRPAVVYGSGQRSEMFVSSLIQTLRRGSRFSMTKGEQKRDLVNVDDVARAILLLLERELEGVFNIGTGKGLPMRVVGELAGRLFGTPDLVGIGDLPYRNQEVWDYALDPSRLMEGTGWSPQVDLEDGIRQAIEWESKAL